MRKKGTTRPSEVFLQDQTFRVVQSRWSVSQMDRVLTPVLTEQYSPMKVGQKSSNDATRKYNPRCVSAIVNMLSLSTRCVPEPKVPGTGRSGPFFALPILLLSIHEVAVPHPMDKPVAA